MVQIRTSNKVLAALEPVTFQRLLPHLEPVGLRRKQVLYEPDAEIRHIYFPETCVIVLVTMMQSGETIESMTVGREGVTWVPALSGATTMPCQTMVAIDGEALRVDVDHDFLAYLLGASRQTVTTLTNEFAKKGYIESDRSITVPDRTQRSE